MANFFSSSEEENLELISSLWNKYKFYVLGAILIFVLGVIGRVIWTESSLKQQEEVTKAFQSFVLSKDDPEIDSKLIAEKIMDEYPNSLYADLSALHLAKIFIENDLLPEAEKLKIRAGQSQQAQKIFNAIQPSLRDLVGEIHRSVGYYKSISKIGKFDKVLLLGKGTRVINFQRFVAQSLSTLGNIPVGRLQKLHQINTDQVDTGALNANLSTIGASIGLALQGFDLTLNHINLLPPEFRKKKELKKN